MALVLVLLPATLTAARNNNDIFIAYADSVGGTTLSSQGNKGAFSLQQLVDDNTYRYKIALLSPELMEENIASIASGLNSRTIGTTDPVYITYDDVLYSVSKDGSFSKDDDNKVKDLEYTGTDGNGNYTFILDGETVGITVAGTSSIDGNSISMTPSSRLTLVDSSWHITGPRTR